MRSWWFALVALFVPTVALAVPGLLPAPHLTDGQFVYAVPADFDPPGISLGGMADIQAAAKALHFPFYVVIVDKLPPMSGEQVGEARDRGYTEDAGNGDLAAAYAIDKVAEDWGATAGYKTDKSTVFLLSYAPRKYRMLAGSKWKTDLGLEKGELVQFHDNFKAAIRGTPKDPKTGIINTMNAFDEYVFDKVDPVKIAERQKAAEAYRAELARKKAAAALAASESNLNSTIMSAQTLLKEDAKMLPPDTSALQSALTRARTAATADSPMVEQLDAATDNLKAAYDPVKTFYEAKEHDAFIEAAKTFLEALVASIVASFLVYLWMARRKEFLTLKTQFDDLHETWSAKVKSAAGKYVDTYADRDNIIGLKDTIGQTKTLWDTLSAEIDDIWSGVKGLEDHLAQCRTWADKAKFFDLEPLRIAIRDIEQPFDFDTGQVNKDELFGGETKVIKIDPVKFANELAKRFKTNQAAWDTLRAAAELRFQSATELFPHAPLTTLLGEAKEANIPLAWYDDHPLAGDDAADAAVWAQADKLRVQDPMAFRTFIDQLKEKEVVVVKRHLRLLTVVRNAQAAVYKLVPVVGTAVGDPSDDPNITFSNARDTHHRLQGVLESDALGKDPGRAEKVSADVVALYNKVKAQVATIQAAVNDVAKDLADTKNLDPTQIKAEANRLYTQALTVHANLGELHANLESGDQLTLAGRENIKNAFNLLSQKRHLEASREVAAGVANYRGATKAYNKTIERVHELNRLREQYIAEQEGYSPYVKGVQNRVKQYGGTAKVINYTFRDTSAPVDFYAEMAALNATKAAWEVQAQSARQAEEARQAANRRQEEDNRRRAREAEEAAASARRAASYSSYSSSYSSSSSDSGSSSSGSSWSSSDSGGSSSSGGDW